MRYWLAFICVSTCVFATPARADEPLRQPLHASQTLVADADDPSTKFGLAIAMHEHRMAVLSDQSLYLYERDAERWTLETRLPLPARDPGTMSLSLGHHVCVVGDAQQEDQRGRVYVFVRQDGTWSREATLTAPDRHAWDLFGESVGVSGNMCIVGAPGDGAVAKFGGAAHVYRRLDDAWSYVQTLRRDDVGVEDMFGSRVGFEGRFCAITSSSPMNRRLVVYRLEGDRFDAPTTLEPPTGIHDGLFEQPATFRERDLLVGGYISDGGGAAVLFEWSDDGTWVPDRIIADQPDGPPTGMGDRFSQGVAAAGQRLILGGGSPWLNRAIVYERTPDGWRRSVALEPKDARASSAVATNGEDCAMTVVPFGTESPTQQVAIWFAEDMQRAAPADTIEPAPGRLTLTTIAALTREDANAMLRHVAQARQEARDAGDQAVLARERTMLRAHLEHLRKQRAAEP